jgi:hypothetical protein
MGNDIKETKRYMDEAVQLAEQVGSHFVLTLAKYGNTLVSVELDDLEAARQNFYESLQMASRFGNRRLVFTNQSEFAHALRQHGELNEALEIYKDLLPKWNRIGHQGALLHELECIAYILIRKDDPDRAGILLGAAKAQRGAIGSPMTAIEQEEYKGEIATIKAALDEETFRKQWRRGSEMSLNEAIKFALAIDIS